MVSTTRLRLHVDGTTGARRLVRAQALVVEARLSAWEADLRNAEALHDARTALRRFRVLVRCFRSELGSKARRGVRRRLRDASRATSALRDLDVFVAWVTTFPASGAARHAVALAAKEADALTEGACRAMRASWDEARRRQRASRAGRRRRQPARVRTFGAAVATALRSEIAILSDGLAGFDPQGAPSAVHATRIAAKRVRYLVEAVAGRSPDTRRVVEWCRAFQNLVGDWRDASLAIHRVRACPPMSGRALLLRRLTLRRRQALAEARRFVADSGAWRTASRDGLAIARRYALGCRRLSPRPDRPG